MFKLNTKFDADSLLYLLSHFECDDHTVHMLTQWHLPPLATSTVKSSLFTHVHSSPLSLAARLHQCCANCSHYISNDWTFSRQTSYMYICAFYIKTTRFSPPPQKPIFTLQRAISPLLRMHTMVLKNTIHLFL